MAIGERIRYFRRKRELTQKELGLLAGYPEKSADIRVAQYESGSRCPKQNCIDDLARILAVSPDALRIPNIDDVEKLMHTLFALEDLYGIRIGAVEDKPFLFVDSTGNRNAAELHSMLLDWAQKSAELESGIITKVEYDQWRYLFSSYNALHADALQQRFHTMVGEAINNRLKNFTVFQGVIQDEKKNC